MYVLQYLKFENETPGMCCAGGKVKLQELHPTPEPMSNLVSDDTSQLKHFLANTITCQHLKWRSNLSSCWITTTIPKFISWETLMNKSINVPDSIPALNDKLSLHYKLYSINTTNEFKRLQFPVLLAFAMTINKERGQ